METIDNPNLSRLVDDEEDSSSSVSGRKRSASLYDKKKGSNKKLAANLEGITDALREPLRMDKLVVQRGVDAWVEEAMDIWDTLEEYKEVPLAVEKAMKRSWCEDSNKALEFVKSKSAYRFSLILEVCEKTGWDYLVSDPELSDDNDEGKKKGKGKERRRSGWAYVGARVGKKGNTNMNTTVRKSSGRNTLYDSDGM